MADLNLSLPAAVDAPTQVSYKQKFQVQADGSIIPYAATGGTGTGAPSTSLPGQGAQVATGSGAALNSGVALACSEVYVQNDPASVGNLLLGPSTGQTIVLTPGSGMSVQINDVSKVYVKFVGGSATANWLARG